MIGDADDRVNASADHALLIASPTGGAQSPRAPPRNVHFMRGGDNQVRGSRACPVSPCAMSDFAVILANAPKSCAA
jgi:hypothetical protein